MSDEKDPKQGDHGDQDEPKDQPKPEDPGWNDPIPPDKPPH